MSTALQHPEPPDVSLIWRALFSTPVGELLHGRVAPWPPPPSSLETVLAQAALSPRLDDLLRRVVRRTRLWRLEQVDVARELVAHFQDGLEAGASAEELAASFGDVRQAARLIRRAKQRHRPLAWKVWKLAERTVGFAFLFVVVVYGVQAARIYSHSPNIARNFLAEWNQPALAVPEAERAWPIYRAAALATGGWPEYGRRADLKPGGEKWPEMAAFAAENREAIELYRRAAAMPTLGAALGPAADQADQEIYRHYSRYYSSDIWPAPLAHEAEQNENPDFISIALPQVTVLREAARLLAIDAYLAAAEGDADRAGADVKALCGMVEHAYQIHFLSTDSLALGLADWACNLVGRLLRDYPQLFDDSRLTELAHRFASFGGLEGLRVTFASEYAMFDDLIQRHYTDDGHGDGLPCPDYFVRLQAWVAPRYRVVPIEGPARDRWMLPALSAVMAGRRETLTKAHHLLAGYEAEARVPLWERQALNVDRELESLQESPLDCLRYLPVVTLMPSLGDATLEGEYAIQIRDATLTAIALELYRRHHGSWPVSLSELTPRLLPQVPPDRYDGKPLKYRLVEGQPLLYSVGVDRDDDGGRVPRGKDGNARADMWRPLSDLQPRAGDPTWQPPPDGDWVLWPPVD
jgi:hypothetical protein